MKITVDFHKDEIAALINMDNEEYAETLRQTGHNIIDKIMDNNIHGAIKKITIEEA